MSGIGYREERAAGLACVWRAALPADAGGPFRQRVVPDGCVDLIWWGRDARITVAGPDTGPAPAELAPGDRLFGVRLRPGTAAPVLGVAVDAVRDARIPLRELWGDEAERLAAAADPRAALLGAVRARLAGPVDPFVPALVAGLGAGSVREAADALGFGERQLRRRAAAAFGYGPKTLQRVLRFQRALGMARAGRPLAEVAYAAGYADQAHLAHEVRALGGVPIRSLL
ncbi:DUF6597 domain-containing transcriptional factor [Actinomadura macrotermitis]|uniref:DUF6597 domain-containing transcriptional factor n=1 Tax=Actinomadura macrotermitis TaxID=2585200 RepID=UPI002E272ABC